MSQDRTGRKTSGGSLRLRNLRIASPGTRREGVILLAVLVFVALLLPLITLVLTSINTESVATAEAIKGTKAEMAAEKAINDAISLVVQEKAYPAYYTSATQPNTAIIVLDPVTGYRRDEVPDQGSPGAAGADDILGTSDDYWVGPRYDRSYIGPDDDEVSSRMYRWDFRFPSMHGPTYIGQSWSFSTDYLPYARSPFTGGMDNWIWQFNQYAAVEVDTDGDGVDDGYELASPFNGNDGFIYGPGYYPGSDEPREGSGVVNRLLDGSNDVESYMYNAKVNIYQSIYTDLDRGPIPTSLLKSYANVSDEAGRLNLNIFCKKVRVYMPESAETDYDETGYGTNDFNLNEVVDEDGWKWMDNPLFPDRNTTHKWDFDPTTGAFAANPDRIDWGRFEAFNEQFSDTQDGVAMPELGESALHYYEGDTDGDFVPQSIEACYNSLTMLMSLPGVTPRLAAEILTYLNPPHDADATEPDRDPWGGIGGSYRTLHADLNTTDDLGSLYNSPPLITDPAAGYPARRVDACNMTPALMALEINQAGGVVTDFRWDFAFTDEDDMPLPPPQPLSTLDELRGLPSMTERQFERLSDVVTIFSYDTNVLANYIQDVGPNADLVNPFVPGDPEYSGIAVLRETPEEMQDTDDVPDLRYDIGRFVFGITLDDYRDAASEMYAYVREHLPRTLRYKVTLPPVDRLGRAGAEDHLVPNTDPRYDLTNTTSPSVLAPHRDPDGNVDSTGFSHPYNVGGSGHQEDWTAGGSDFPGAGYPALNTSFSLESCLSILMYRNGTYFEEDDYTYNPDSGAWRPAANRGIGSFFGFGAPWFVQIFGPFSSLLADWMQSHNNPYTFAGENVDPFVRPHGPGNFDYENLINYGGFDTVADLLDVPRYEFGRMSVSLMATPPSDFRYNLDSSNNNVDTSIPEEFGAVNYYIAFSDVVDLGWYMSNINPDGPDNRPGTGDEPDMNAVLYYLYFTIGNRPGLNWAPGSADLTAVIPLTPMQLQAVGAGADSTSSKVTIVAHDNFNNLDVLGYMFTQAPAFSSTLGPLGGSGDLQRRFGWDDVPEPTTAWYEAGTDADGRPLENSYWNTATLDGETAYPGPQFSTAAEREAWAFDAEGDPYLTARVEVRRWDPVADAEALPNVRTDDVSQVYLQYNQEADIPFRVDVLPVRIAGDQFELRSAYGGAETRGGRYLLYDWDYGGVPDSYDGTWPPHGWQTGDPRVIRITPDTPTVTLRLYDLRTFSDSFGGVPYLPLPAGDYTNPAALPPPVVLGDEVQLPPSFPADPIYGGGYPVPGTVGFATDTVSVTLIASSPIVEAQIAAEEPSLWSDDATARVFASATGGTMPYTYRVRILDPGLGSGAGGVNPYTGPDGGVVDITGWPGLGVPPRPSRLTPPGLAYDDTVVGSVIASQTRVSNDIDEEFTFDPVSLGMGSGNGYGGEYWVELQVIDSAGAPASDLVYTQIVVGGDASPGGSAGIPPSMNASINLRALEDNRKGFVCSAGVDGGEGGYSYRWEIHRPRYGDSSATLDMIVGTEIVDSGSPYVSIDADNPGAAGASSIAMVSNEPNPTFEFHTFDRYDNRDGSIGGDGIPDADGVYFVHCYVLDRASSSPGFASSTIAHDVAMVTLSDAGTGGMGTPSTSGIARTPMAVLHASPPGNGNAPIGDNPQGSGGANQPFIGAIGLHPDTTVKSALEPDVAANGEVIVIRGYNFAAPTPPAPGGIPAPHPDGAASDNIVTFGGGLTAQGLAVFDDGEVLNIGGILYRQMALYVRVPDGARSGFLTVTTPDGTSERVFFQTGFDVTFDLIGKLSANDPTYLSFDLDYQGDGHIDYSFNTMANPSAPGEIRGAQQGITHDYAADGIGNYMATLYVTDLISGRQAVSHQLITVKDRRPMDDRELVISTGTVTALGGANPQASFTDAGASFLSDGVRVGDRIINLTVVPNESASVLEVYSNVEIRTALLNGGSAWAVGDAYRIVRPVSFSDDEGTSALLVSIFPEIDLRSETFTADPSTGVSFGSATGGAGTGLVRKWQVDLNGSPDSDEGGFLVTRGTATATDLSGITLVDANADFINAGRFGVREGDLVLLEERDDDGIPPPPDATADVRYVDSATQLTLHDPADPSFSVGLNNGSVVTRIGAVDTVLPGFVPGATYVIEDNNYDWVGDGASLATGVHMGGVLANNTPFPGDTIINVTNGNSPWLVLDDYNTDAALAADQIRVTYTGPPVGQTPAVVTAVSGGPLPPGVDAQITINIAANPAWANPPGTILHNDTSSSIWRIIGVPGPSDLELRQLGGSGIINVGDQLRINPVGAGAPPPAWVPGDTWRVSMPANQLRIGFQYGIYTADGFGTGAWADATYADLRAPVDFNVELTFPYDLDPTPDNPTTVLVDWDGDSVVDGSYAVGQTSRLDGAVNGIEIESVEITHAFVAAELAGPVGSPGGAPTVATYYVVATPRGVAFSNTYGPYSLPVVTVGGDDYDTDLTTLNVSGWDNSSWHRVCTEVSYSFTTNLMDRPLAGTTNLVSRTYSAGDQMLIPPGMEDYPDTLATWVSYTKPFVNANNVGVTSMRHQGVHGAGSALNWVSDANADTRWIAGENESPLGDNPVNYHEFLFLNGQNLMNVPGAGIIQGASFPAAVNGVGRTEVSGSFNYYRADRGVYNGFGFVTDDLPPEERAFAFDSQPFFWGDRVQGGDTEQRPLVADFTVSPLVGSNSQLVELTSYVTGGASQSAAYTYRWFVEKYTGASIGFVGLDGAYGAGPSSQAPSPLLSPWLDISDEAWYGGGDDGSGRYRVWLVVSDGAGQFTACQREFNIVTPTLSVSMMANPPSSSVGSEIQYAVFVDGGTPPYSLSFDLDGDGSTDVTRTLNQGNETVVPWSFNQAGSYNSSVTVTDSSAGPATDTDSTTVEIAETIPLNATLLVTPASGVAPFIVYVHYAISGGREIGGGPTGGAQAYNVTLQLVNVDGEVIGSHNRNAYRANTFGRNGIPDDPRLPVGLDTDNPAEFVVPEAGNYYVQLLASDNDGAIVTRTEDVFASGYLMPSTYGDSAPQVMRDGEGRPMHAVRIWVDPFLNIDSTGTDNYSNVPSADLSGGRLMEADLQVLGDVLTTDPNPSFRSYGLYATRDPLSQPLYYANYTLDAQGEDRIQDFYDTFTMGRININTASEDVLTALFRRIIKERDYDYDVDVGDVDGDGTADNFRVVRDERDDVYLSEAEARALAQKVIRYRTAYYDLHKPAAPDASDEFGYTQTGYTGGYPELGGAFRVDHLPVIGPWDGTNPHEYGLADRNNDLAAPDNSDSNDINNAWDHAVAGYYNIDPDAYQFYSPSDIAVVRDRWQADVLLTAEISPGQWQTFQVDIYEPVSNYAKYLNDLVHNGHWETDRAGEMSEWSGSGLYQVGNDHYSRWAFDARNYFTYPGGEYDVQLTVDNAGNITSFTFDAVPGTFGEPQDARNEIGIIDSNDVTAYSYIPNPPFRNLFDLYKVIEGPADARTFPLDDTSGNYYLELDSDGFTPDDADFDSNPSATTYQVFSGPSAFRYAARWDDERGEFIPIANYLDDIAPYVTCRSYVYRVEASGAVTASGGAAGALVDTAKISRDRSKVAVVDVGPLWSRRDAEVLDDVLQGAGLTSRDRDLSYRILWYRDDTN